MFESTKSGNTEVDAVRCKLAESRLIKMGVVDVTVGKVCIQPSLWAPPALCSTMFEAELAWGARYNLEVNGAGLLVLKIILLIPI